MVRNRAEEPGFRSRSLDDSVDERGCRGLAVRAGHRYELERLGRVPEEICRGDSQRLARMRHANPSHARRYRRRRHIFAGNGHCSTRHRVADKSVSVRLGPMQRKKQRAWLHLARIANHFANI